MKTKLYTVHWSNGNVHGWIAYQALSCKAARAHHREKHPADKITRVHADVVTIKYTYA